ncbi:MAG: hypothetical protein NXH75_10445 [Halobacteriovoraceae bacterium]|nr:hypothetical protein [Halobacteriovoraceae bacterium]
MKNTPHKTKFSGLLTQLLSEAFYLESSEKENIIDDLLPFEKEEQSDQNDFIRNFLKPYQTPFG